MAFSVQVSDNFFSQNPFLALLRLKKTNQISFDDPLARRGRGGTAKKLRLP